MAFRSKSPDRVVEEIAELRERYGVPTFSVVDDILDMRYFKSVLPMLTEARLGADFFWEVKANLTAEHVRQLRDAGVVFIQPGIESLNDHVLDLMRKGTTGFRNIELLKWCKEYGVKPLWNLLYGFPGETASDYAETVELIEAIWHLDPPTGYGPIRLDRFSPYHAEPEAFGMENIRPDGPVPHPLSVRAARGDGDRLLLRLRLRGRPHRRRPRTRGGGAREDMDGRHRVRDARDARRRGRDALHPRHAARAGGRAAGAPRSSAGRPRCSSPATGRRRSAS